MERTAKDIKHGAREAGEQARDWAENAGEDARDWFYNKAEALRSNGPDGEDIERNFERLKSKAQQGWNTARDEAREAAALARHRGYQYRDDISDDLQDRGQDMRRGAEQMKDQFQDWAQDRSHEFHGRFEQMRDRGQDWAQDRRREFQKWGREMEDQADRSGRDFKRRAQDLRDMGEDHFKNARREFRNGAEEWRHHGRHHLRNLERDVDDIGSRHDEHEEIAGRGRRRSVTETAKEGKSWWPQRHYEAEEGRDDMRPASSSTKASWWKAGSTSKDQAMEQFDQAKDHAQRGMGHLKDSLKETAESGRSWVSDKSGDIRDRFEHGKHQAEREFHDKFSRDRNYRHEQGRDYGERPQRASSVNSNDNWFHLDHSVDNRAYAGRGRERGM
ncbi:hypothetical protein B0O80DRAFT_433939 [Mortierella sp. GBAus27b]|nr:hypothetical protein B0O80DRAFT_433939 [Mortierella sp. GBAus27b]